MIRKDGVDTVNVMSNLIPLITAPDMASCHAVNGSGH